MTFQPMLALWDEPTMDHRHRVVADSTDRLGWLRARRSGITATDAARLSSIRSIPGVAREKLHGSNFAGNAYTDHGTAREPQIAAWVLANHGIPPSSQLFHALGEKRHLATPDGIVVRSNGAIELAEIKTTNKTWRGVPRAYLRQVWWQQYVLGAERTLVVWEQHEGFVPMDPEPKCCWIDRDETEIVKLIGLANQLLGLMSRGLRHH